MKKKTITCPLRGEACHKEGCEWYIVYEKDTGICAIHSISEGIWSSYNPPKEEDSGIEDNDEEVEEVKTKDLHRKSCGIVDVSTYIR